MWSKRIIPWLLVVVLVVLLVCSLKKDSGEPIVIERHTTDTLTLVVHDTMYITKVKTEVKRVVDTVFYPINDTILVPIPRREYNFSEEGVFDFRVKGVEVEFLDAKVYPKTVYTTITNTIEKERVVHTWNLYLGGGIWAFNNELVPKVNLMVKTPNKWLFGANMGYYKSGVMIGVSANYKIMGK